MKVYIAGPFFNQKQVEIIESIKDHVLHAGHRFYDPRTMSGSADFSPEDRKDMSKWKPIFESNVQQIHECDVVLAVVEYALPENTQLGLMTPATSPADHNVTDNPLSSAGMSRGYPASFKPIEIPDTGTVYEMGYARAISKPVIGFHSRKYPEELNLMLLHGCDGIITGFPVLYRYLNGRITLDQVISREIQVI